MMLKTKKSHVMSKTIVAGLIDVYPLCLGAAHKTVKGVKDQHMSV